MLFTFYIFNRWAECISYIEWHRESPNTEGQNKLCSGLVSSLQLMMRMMTTRGDESEFRSMTTHDYRLHYLETITGFRFVLLSHPRHPTAQMHQLLKEFYSEVFVEWVVKDVKYSHQQGVMIESAQFLKETNDFMRKKELLQS